MGGRNVAGVAKRGAGTEWYPEDFKTRLDKAKATQDKTYIKSVLKEVAENNYALRDKWPVPRSNPVTLEACLRSKVTGMGPDPEVTFSNMTTADAMLYFGVAPSRKVVALNFANGQTVGGGYKNGAMAQEEDLCRRCPTLYTSLFNAKKDGYYPFGPCTCRNPSTPGKYSDVLWTPAVTVARLGENDGFAILPKEQQATVSMVAAAAPNIKFADPPEYNNPELVLNTIKAILIAPLMMQPELTTMILGAWGCGAFGGDPEVIGELFVKALVNERYGRLYKEIHFAIPKPGSDPNADTFREVLKRHGVKVKDIEG